MKMPSYIDTILTGGVVLVATLAGLVGYQYFEPRRLVWEAVSPANKPQVGDKLIVAASTTRLDSPGCSNSPQVDMMLRGSEHRLPVPERAMSGNGDVTYDIVLPDEIEAGFYSVRLREIFNCNGRRRQIIDTPWIRFEVLPAQPSSSSKG